MPYIHIQTNRPIDKKQRETLTAALGKAVTVLGKSEIWLMLRFEGDCDMAFRGRSDEPTAFVGVSLYGQGRSLERFTGEVCRCLEDHLGIDPGNTYVRYVCTPDWGWNGSNF